MSPESPHHESGESGEFVLATYREIALRFGLGSPNAARTKAKRAGWGSEPTNHPADALRIRVPREAWDQAVETPHRIPRERGPTKTREGPSQTEDSRHIRALEEHIATLRERLAQAEARIVRAEERADREEAQAEWNEGRADRAEAELRRERETARRLGEQVAALAADVARLAATPAPATTRPRLGARLLGWIGWR